MPLEEFGYHEELRRVLTMRDLIIYGMIFMVPIAPFSVYGFVWNDAKGMVPLAYFVGLVGMAFTALSYAAMSRAFPLAGRAAKILGACWIAIGAAYYGVLALRGRRLIDAESGGSA